MSFYFQCERFCGPPQPACKKPTRTLGDHCFKTTSIQRNDVKIVTPASAYPQRNNEEPFGVLVDSLNHFNYLCTIDIPHSSALFIKGTSGNSIFSYSRADPSVSSSRNTALTPNPLRVYLRSSNSSFMTLRYGTII